MGGIRKLLVANRGEIAVRIIRACREMGIRTVAVYSDADANALHVRLADEAGPIGPPPPRESYLRIDRLLDVARAAAADAVHPGYGFLSENADFAQAVRDEGLIFVGPPTDAIRRMGSKTQARAIMRGAGVPVVPGYEGAVDGGLAEAAAAIGYPVLVKAAGGGGGRGMRIVRAPGELVEEVASARREAASAFGDEAVFLEKYIERGRHVEFQVLGDGGGNVVHLFERECSIQRRHQKIVEETPSPLLTRHPELREQMAEAALAAARAVGYQNAGTVEFMVDQAALEFYFLEMNTRLQVEHPITEAVTGIDLVQAQIRIAGGQPLWFGQGDILPRGHAIECRVYAEDPEDGFLPSAGPVLQALEPVRPGVRVDTSLAAGDEVSPHYDSLVAKVIAHAETRAGAVRRMAAALEDYVLLGMTTNISFLRSVMGHPAFERGETTTRFVEQHWEELRRQRPPDEGVIAAAIEEYMAATRGGRAPAAGPDAWDRADGFRPGA